MAGPGSTKETRARGGRSQTTLKHRDEKEIVLGLGAAKPVNSEDIDAFDERGQGGGCNVGLFKDDSLGVRTIGVGHGIKRADAGEIAARDFHAVEVGDVGIVVFDAELQGSDECRVGEREAVAGVEAGADGSR